MSHELLILVDGNSFIQRIQHFLAHVKPSTESRVLLILDEHYSHTRNVDIIELATENDVLMISVPRHTTHNLQPLEKSVMAPLKV
jgi:hypothetical protein